MTSFKGKMYGHKFGAETKNDHTKDAKKSKGLTIDHVIIFVVSVVLSITIINTYTSVHFY